MRTFSKIETEIIQRMIELDDKVGSLNVLGNIFDSFSKELSLPDFCYIKVKSTTDVSIQIKKEVIDQIDPSGLRAFDDQLSKFILTIIKLFEYLENNGLAYFIGNLNLASLGQVWVDTEYVTCEFLEKESKELIYKYTQKKIYITEELRELSRNGFKSKEQIRHEEVISSTEQELKFTRIALALAFIGLIASIIIPLFATSTIEVVKEIRVKNFDSKSESIKVEIEEIGKIISSLTKAKNHDLETKKDSHGNCVKK